MSAAGALRISLRRVLLRLRAPILTAHGDLRMRVSLVIRAEDSAGLAGLGEACPLPWWGTETAAEAEATLLEAARQLHGLPAPRSTAAVEELLRAVRRPAARAGLELALLDLLARREGVPLCKLLAPEPLRDVRASALLTADDDAALAEQAGTAAAAGFATVKLKVAALSLERDLARARAVRAAAGDSMELRLDANGGWTAAQAARALRALAEVRPEFCEQPVAPGQPAAWAALAQLCPLAADESCSDPVELEALLRERALAAVVLKPALLGGLLPSLRLAGLARSAGAEPVLTSALDGAIGRAGALHLAAALRVSRAAGLATGALLEEDLCDDPAPPRGGSMAVPQIPGLGIAT